MSEKFDARLPLKFIVGEAPGITFSPRTEGKKRHATRRTWHNPRGIRTLNEMGTTLRPRALQKILETAETLTMLTGPSNGGYIDLTTKRNLSLGVDR